MTVPLHHVTPVSEVEARRATEAYRLAERLGNTSQFSEWRRLCKADYTRRSLEALQEILPAEKPDREESSDWASVAQDDDQAKHALYWAGALAAGICSLVFCSMLLP